MAPPSIEYKYPGVPAALTVIEPVLAPQVVGVIVAVTGRADCLKTLIVSKL